MVSLSATVVMFLSSVSPVFATGQSQGFVSGLDAYAEKQQDTAIGRGAQAKGDGATAVGSYSQAAQLNSTAVGYYAKAMGHGATAMGTLATTMANVVTPNATTLDTAIGYKAESLVWGGVALGSHSKADIEGGTLGYDPESDSSSSKESFIWKSTKGAVSVGDVSLRETRQIIGVAAGTGRTDAVNIAQLRALRRWVESKGSAWKLSVNGKNTTKVNGKNGLNLTGGNNIKIIKNSKNNKNNKLTFDLKQDLRLKSVTMGSARLNNYGLFIRNGPRVTVTGIDAGRKKITNMAEGKLSEKSQDVVNGAQLYSISNNIAKYLGGSAVVREGVLLEPRYTLSRVFADGNTEPVYFSDVGSALKELDANVKNVNSHLKYVSGNFTEAIDKISQKFKHSTLLWNRRERAFVALHTEGGKRKNSKLTFLMDGDIAPNSTDAVTGRQLWKTNEKVNNFNDKVDNVIDRVNTLTAEVITYDKDEYGKKTNSITLVGGKEDEPVVINNVADGEIEKGSKQAVNGGQLKEQMSVVLADANKYANKKIKNIVSAAFTQANAYADMKFEALNYRVEGVQKEARQAAAIGLAVASLHYINTPGTLSIAFGSGVWRGQSALAFGTGYMSEDGTVCSNFSVTTSGGHWGIGAGLSLALK
ncbi:YadA-like family protein [Bartonella schoenbuchensis]|uniref:YadA-like family protein n=1 Tax=Bartonella schoenbuchensis TaxID=165694 RepID=UPI0031455E4E